MMSLRKTGNYRHGALEEGEHTCEFNAQFEEKRCRLKLRLSSTVCNDTVTLRYDTANPTLESICKQPPDSLVLWSMGNHPLNGESLRLCCLKLHFHSLIYKTLLSKRGTLLPVANVGYNSVTQRRGGETTPSGAETVCRIMWHTFSKARSVRTR